MKLIFSLASLLFSVILFAQNNRQSDFNNINWVQAFVTKKISPKTDWLIEYQWRRTNGLTDWQQGLFRTAVQYKPNSNFTLAIGYAQAEIFSYGDFPIAANGSFPEHRIFEQAIIKQNINKFSISNRFRIEQRWLGKVEAGTNREIESWTFLHRFRYLLKVQYPFNKKMYAWLGNEIFIGAGKNLGVNIFDQNRIHASIGYKINNHVNIELGYINQVLQQGRVVNSKTILQRNNGLTLASAINF
ncbi:MAG: DUF2490 domain-containing protein [Ferruginibacter sp.]